MEFDIFKKISPLPFISVNDFFDSKNLQQNKTCIKCKKLECINLNNYKNNEFICYKGFNNFLLSLKNNNIIFNGLILSENTKINKVIKEVRKEYILKRSALEIKISELEEISNAIDEGIKGNIKDRFSLFHDVRSSYAVTFSNIESFILKAPGKSFIEKLQNCDQEIIDLYDSLDLVNSQLELIDVMVNPAAIVQGTKKAINLFKLSDKLRKLYAAKAEKKDLTIYAFSKMQIPDKNFHDSIKLIPIILIENAIKYSEHGNEIHITFNYTDKIEMSVSSYGLIVPPEERIKIFEKHYRGANSEEYTKEGIGMGLFIAANILAKHNGTIKYIPEEKGRGFGFNKFQVLI